jgi:hypothetical protein
MAIMKTLTAFEELTLPHKILKEKFEEKHQVLTQVINSIEADWQALGVWKPQTRVGKIGTQKWNSLVKARYSLEQAARLFEIELT